MVAISSSIHWMMDVNRIKAQKKLKILNPKTHQQMALKYILKIDNNFKGHCDWRKLYPILINQTNLTKFVYKKFKDRELGSPEEAKLVIQNYRKLKKNTKDYLRSHQIRLLYNALPTHNRFNKGIGKKINNPVCTFCSIEKEERIEHIFGGHGGKISCPTTFAIRVFIAKKFNRNSIITKNFKIHLLAMEMDTPTIKFIIAYNYALWMCRYWIIDHQNKPTLKQMKNYMLKEIVIHLLNV